MRQVLNTAFGSFIKAFITAILTLVVAHGGLKGLDWTTTLDAALVSCIPVIINYLNPHDTRYGNGKQSEQQG